MQEQDKEQQQEITSTPATPIPDKTKSEQEDQTTTTSPESITTTPTETAETKKSIPTRTVCSYIIPRGKHQGENCSRYGIHRSSNGKPYCIIHKNLLERNERAEKRKPNPQKQDTPNPIRETELKQLVISPPTASKEKRERPSSPPPTPSKKRVARELFPDSPSSSSDTEEYDYDESPTQNIKRPKDPPSDDSSEEGNATEQDESDHEEKAPPAKRHKKKKNPPKPLAERYQYQNGRTSLKKAFKRASQLSTMGSTKKACHGPLSLRW